MLHIAGVVTRHASTWFSCCDCGCTADEVVVDLNRELGLDPVPPLAVRRGGGWQVAQLIQAAADEATKLHSTGKQMQAISPNVLYRA